MNAPAVVAAVVDALDRASVSYMLVGSFSSNLYSFPRSTKDADFVVELSQISLGALMSSLGADFALDPQMSFETVTATMRHVITHRDSGFKVELFGLSNDPHDQLRFSRRRPAPFLGRTIWVPRAEDVVITKLRWSKGGRRRKDVEDVENVLAVQGDALDFGYIRHWCDQHGTRQLFEQALADANAPPPAA
jgi:hypothetical protein